MFIVCLLLSTLTFKTAVFYLFRPSLPSTTLTLAPYVMIGSQYDGCDGTPRYGTRDGPLSYCQAHKRTGLYTVRDGVLYVATRDGNGALRRWTHALGASGVRL